MSIKVYTGAGCSYCPMVKKYLALKGLEYEEIDADADNRQSIFELTGRTLVPVVVTDKGVSVGYNLSQLAEIIV